MASASVSRSPVASSWWWGSRYSCFPVQGWLVIFLGLGILATEFVWAERLLNKAKEKAQQAKDKVLQKKARRTARKADRTSSDPPNDAHATPPPAPAAEAGRADDDAETA
jgi:hypothetical protein